MSAHPAGSRHEQHQPEATVNVPDSNREPGYLDPRVWPRGTTRDEHGTMVTGDVAVTELADTYATPLFVLNETDFRSRCAEMAAAFGGAHNVHYASKAFLTTEIARWVTEEGLSIDVASGGELAIALRADFPPQHITVHGNNKSVEELTAAVQARVGHIVVDSMMEIERLQHVAAGLDTVQDVLVRATVGVEAHTHEFIATAHEDQKFGFSLAGGAAEQAAYACLNAENIRLRGFHSHIGSQIFEIDGFELAARRVVELLKTVSDSVEGAARADLDTVDLGGGLGICYTSADNPPPVATLAASLKEIVRTHAEKAGVATPQMVVEPGRAIAGPSTLTLYEVGTIKDIELATGDVRRYISVDGGMSDNIRTSLYNAEYECTLANRVSQAELVLCRVVGKHCESGDVVIRDTWLPEDVGPGDLLAVAATGAYCYSMSSRYNQLPRAAVAVVKDGASRLMLRRETLEDLVSLEVDN